MKQYEHSAGVCGPFKPRCGHLTEICSGRQSLLHRLGGQVRIDNSISPHLGPLGSLFGGGNKFSRCREKDVVEPCFLCPCQQPAASIGGGAVACPNVEVELEPVVEYIVVRPPVGSLMCLVTDSQEATGLATRRISWSAATGSVR